MDHGLLLQFLTLSIYAVFLGFTFCDGFTLPLTKKLICFIPFICISFFVLRVTGKYDLALILPIPTLLAFFLCVSQRDPSKRTAPKEQG
jgi:hypothetical protein